MPLEGLFGSAKRQKASSPYTFKNTAELGVGGIIAFDLQEGTGDFVGARSGGIVNTTEYQARLPFSNISILNNDTSNPILFIPNNNPDHAITVLNRAAQDLGDVAILRWQVQNLGSGTPSAGSIIITVWNE
jgi:hypothetical protein